MPDSLGTGDGQGNLPGGGMAETVRRFTSKGYVRNQLLVLNGGAANGTTGMSAGTGPWAQAVTTAVAASGVSQELVGSTGSPKPMPSRPQSFAGPTSAWSACAKHA